MLRGDRRTDEAPEVFPEVRATGLAEVPHPGVRATGLGEVPVYGVPVCDLRAEVQVYDRRAEVPEYVVPEAVRPA